MDKLSFSIRDLLEAGVHYGHHPRRWNPKMSSYLFGVRNGVHIINLEYTVPLLNKAIETIRKVVSGGGRVLFVGTKRQAASYVAEAAKRSSQYYVNHRWLGGMLTNWKTVSQSIDCLKDIEEKIEKENSALTKKELLKLTTRRNNLEKTLGGIKDMGAIPDVLFIVDAVKEKIAIKEASKLGIPVIGIVDSNADPASVSYPIPGNDDARRSISFFCNIISEAILIGLQDQMIKAGVDLGESEDIPSVDQQKKEKLDKKEIVSEETDKKETLKSKEIESNRKEKSIVESEENKLKVVEDKKINKKDTKKPEVDEKKVQKQDEKSLKSDDKAEKKLKEDIKPKN